VLDPRLRIARAGLPAETAAAEQADETPAE
jgi:hypothetical protein